MLNVILDPIFIFGFGMGVRGAAIATVISQMISCVAVLLYVFRFAHTIRFAAPNLRLEKAIILRVLALGSSSFISQAAITILNIVMNNSLKRYGASSPFGSDIPLAAMGIVMKINAIMTSTIVGIMMGAQPILGYNYGARQYGRVKRTLLTEIGITFSLSTICCLLFVFLPEPFISLFGDKTPEFTEFASRALSVYLCCIFAAGIQLPSAGYFQATGKPMKSMALTMTRQLLVIVPLILILPIFFGLDGVLYAGPVGDICALLVTSVFILRELRYLGQGQSQRSGEEVISAD